jgi:hypothetical protein
MSAGRAEKDVIFGCLTTDALFLEFAGSVSIGIYPWLFKTFRGFDDMDGANISAHVAPLLDLGAFY